MTLSFSEILRLPTKEARMRALLHRFEELDQACQVHGSKKERRDVAAQKERMRRELLDEMRRNGSRATLTRIK